MNRPILMMKHQQGTSFIEVIVATAILAIGMLGVAHLQVSGARFNTGSYARTQATVMASSILDEIRSYGSAVAISFDGASGGAACDPFGTTPGDAIACWQQEISEVLPSGVGDIEVVEDADGTHVAVTINWTEIPISKDDTGTAPPPLDKSLTMEADI